MIKPTIDLIVQNLYLHFFLITFKYTPYQFNTKTIPYHHFLKIHKNPSKNIQNKTHTPKKKIKKNPYNLHSARTVALWEILRSFHRESIHHRRVTS